ncbi:hypothetical protein HPB47_021447, partial [Ixodes persulcatus]
PENRQQRNSRQKPEGEGGQGRTGMAGPGCARQDVVTRSRADEFSLLTEGSKERASPEPRAFPIDVTAHVTRKASTAALSCALLLLTAPELAAPKTLSQKDCGRREPSRYRIVGGAKAGLGSSPWIALLMHARRKHPGYEPACGGALITAKVVLTAAHCVEIGPNE